MIFIFPYTFTELFTIFISFWITMHVFLRHACFFHGDQPQLMNRTNHYYYFYWALQPSLKPKLYEKRRRFSWNIQRMQLTTRKVWSRIIFRYLRVTLENLVCTSWWSLTHKSRTTAKETQDLPTQDGQLANQPTNQKLSNHLMSPKNGSFMSQNYNY